MSDTSFAFEAPDAGVEEEAAGSRRNLLLAAGLALVVAVGAFFLLTGGGEEEEVTFVPSARPAVAPSATPLTEAVLPVESQIQLGRNPFKPLYIAPAVAAETGDTGAAPVAAPVVQPTAPQVIVIPGDSPTLAPAPTQTFVPAPVPAPTRPAPAPSPTATTPPAPVQYALTLIEVYGDGTQATGVFDVDSDEMIAKVGSVFGPTGQIKLLELGHRPDGTWYATLMVGDGDPFDVLVDETVYIP